MIPSGEAAAATRRLDPGAQIEALRARGAERTDPVGFCFIEALARRAADQRHGARDLLDRRLAAALDDYRERVDRAEREARDRVADGAARFPEAADALRQHCAAGDFRGLRRLLARLEGRRDGGFLADLLAGIAKHSADSADAVPAWAPVARRVELKSLKYFRRTWSKLSVDRQLSEAFAQAPDNAGPLNSHFLVLRALGLMRDISPEYVGEFVPYIDALLWLDQAASARGATQKNPVRAEAGKKRKPARGKAG